MSFAAFLKKEFTEVVKTSKIIILPAIFLFFGVLSPLSAKYMNQILAMAGEQQGMKIQLPDPTYLDAYMQFFKNLYFMMIVITILLIAGSIAEEKSKGTAALVLTKCLSRNGFIIGKEISALVLFTVSYALSCGICIYYTYLLFGRFSFPGLFTSLFLYWAFGLLMITLTLLASTLAKSMTIAVVGGFAGFAMISAAGALPKIGDYTPGALQVLSVQLVQGVKTAGDTAAPLAVTALTAAAAVLFSLLSFKKQEL